MMVSAKKENGDLHRHGDGRYQQTRQGHHEEHEEQRKPDHLERGGAEIYQYDAGQYPDQGTEFDELDILRTTDRVEQQTNDKNAPADHLGRAADGRVVSMRLL